MKKIFASVLVMLIVFSMMSFFASAEDVSKTGGCNSLDAQVPFFGTQKLVDNAVSAILYEANTDTLMYADNIDEQLPPVSLVKILTAIIAIEKGNLSDAVTVRSDVLATLPEDAAVVELIPDEVLTLEDLINCMMIASGNDAAVVLADHVMGSQEAFVAEMNRYASDLGCTATNFTNVHGLSDPNQYTTALDMARIVAYAIQNETFLSIYGDIYYNVPETNKFPIRYLESENYLMNDDKVMIYYDSRVIGSRTGIANDWSRSLATVARDENLTLVCIVMGAKSEYAEDGYTTTVYGGYDETSLLFDMGFEGHKTAQIFHENQILKQYSIANGDCDLSIGTYDSAFSVIPSTMDAMGLSYRYTDEIELKAPIEKGQKVSNVQVWCGGVCIAQAELYAMNSVSEVESFSGDFGQEVKGSLKWILYVFLVLFGVIALFIVVLWVLRTVNMQKAKSAHRSYRRRSR